MPRAEHKVRKKEFNKILMVAPWRGLNKGFFWAFGQKTTRKRGKMALKKKVGHGTYGQGLGFWDFGKRRRGFKV
jgi:hypothetical protein